MGGDYAPTATIDGVLLALGLLPPDVELILFGNEPVIREEFAKRGADTSSVGIVDCTEVIEMADKPTKALIQKPDSSIAKAFAYLSQKKIDAFASAGNTGAMVVGAVFSLGTIPGVLRPCITTLLPKEKGGVGLLLDVGANPDCKPENLKQFAIIGEIYAKHVLSIEQPKVALLNIGEEEEKGNLLCLSAYKILKESTKLNFTGNAEGHDLFGEKADVFVCDGFTGNIVLKACESMYALTIKRGISDAYFNRFNYENYGGTPVLGIDSTVVIGHGISNSKAIKNMLLLTHQVYKAKLSEKIEEALGEYI